MLYVLLGLFKAGYFCGSNSGIVFQNVAITSWCMNMSLRLRLEQIPGLESREWLPPKVSGNVLLI